MNNQSEEDYGALDSGEEAALDDVITDVDSDVDDAVSDLTAEDGSEVNDEQDAAEIELAKEFVDTLGGRDQLLAGKLKGTDLRALSASGWGEIVEPNVYEELQTPYVPVTNDASYPGLHQGYAGPTPEGTSEVTLRWRYCFYFMPVALWQHIAISSNKYQRDMLLPRVDDAYQRHKKRCRANPQIKKKTRRDIHQELQGVQIRELNDCSYNLFQQWETRQSLEDYR
ncbi:hypothetical protein PHMEG_00024752 [Phytophthora megakarya]|uniref:Uncharacterized protein n=1 Tax=Phytophthora megakarya TaxID=4795 RepID=A0A225VFE1_9STRA|nr:hypothetical protein PHMEG_00024752 [Phytophthora megakarya]